MEQQIRVFFRDKFDEIYQEQERHADAKRTNKIEKEKLMAKIEKGQKYAIELDLKERLEKVCKEYWVLKAKERKSSRKTNKN
mmetsp:Transcript_7094/g.8056  ORF Transcript_7094/g.8056 Transcript_7094/m.8056 type:complete len:82 (+) Transcript_7094:1441-1686(+)